VLGFALRGDLLGLDGLCEHRHDSSAIALEDGYLAVMPFAELGALARRLPAFERLLHRAVGAELLARTEIQHVMASPSSEVRVARFLPSFARRQSEIGVSDRRFRFGMTRREIANCLGVAHETVTRAGCAGPGRLHPRGASGHRDRRSADARRDPATHARGGPPACTDAGSSRCAQHRPSPRQPQTTRGPRPAPGASCRPALRPRSALPCTVLESRTAAKAHLLQRHELRGLLDPRTDRAPCFQLAQLRRYAGRAPPACPGTKRRGAKSPERRVVTYSRK
jgi:hypothetical protein